MTGRRDRGPALARVSAVVAAAIALAGCATTAPAPVTAPAQAASGVAPVPGGTREWAGRFAVSVERSGTEVRPDAASGRFELSAIPAGGPRPALALRLYSPFGQTIAIARQEADGSAALELADGRRARAATLEGLLETTLGYPLPLDRLPDWLDQRFERVLERNAAGTVVAALDSGWRIGIEPRRWVLLREQPQGRLSVVLVLDR